MPPNKQELKLIIQPKVIDHLGIKMYQKPVDVISEFVANAWDADSEIADIKIEADKITIIDRGIGMTFNQCQDFFLTVGRDRRRSLGSEQSKEKGRPVLGRKGIGKFAGFGIAKTIKVTSISKETGELTAFEMNIEEILQSDAQNENAKPIRVTNYQEPDNSRKASNGTEVILIGVPGNSVDINEFKKELSRRFLLSQIYDDFVIQVNGQNLPESFSDQMEFVFPQDLSEEEKIKMPNLISVDKKGWAEEKFGSETIQWRIGLYEEPIEVEELRGISIFAKGKLAQKPFFFDLASAISGQLAIEYMTGQVKMDFIDEGANDLIATERQRINLQTEAGKRIKEWGIERIKLISTIWKKRRSEKKVQELEDKLSGFKDRLDALPASERKTVKKVLLTIAKFERLGKQRFQDWCNDILTSWEMGRLRELITKISEAKEIEEQDLLEILSEADILTALNIAETVKTKILAIGELKQRVLARQLENKVRDFIYEHPWIIHPKWESFRKERSVTNLVIDLGNKNLTSQFFSGRVDLTLASGSSLLLVEFIRPGLEIDLDHLDRINYYVLDIRSALSKETGNVIRSLETAYIIADSKKDIELVHQRIAQLEDHNIYVMTWGTLIEQALKQWADYLDLLKQRNPSDKRIQDL